MMQVSTKKIIVLVCCFFGLLHSFSSYNQITRVGGWSECSFIVKPSPLDGVGVFATHDIPAGTLVFNQGVNLNLRTLKIEDVPAEFIKYCIYINDEECLCPERFDQMEVRFYINHSSEPNIATKESLADVIDDINTSAVYAIKDIKAGDEIVMDYNYLNEPKHLQEEYIEDTIISVIQ